MQNLLLDEFLGCREYSERLCDGLHAEDLNLQAADFASPGKWHLAHTSWFFETFILLERNSELVPYHNQYQVLFNSYYNGVGLQHARSERGNLSRPLLADIIAYRQYVTGLMTELLTSSSVIDEDLAGLVKLGIEHEKQHQELFITDLKYNFFQNPLHPTVSLPRLFSASEPKTEFGDLTTSSSSEWLRLVEGMVEIGFSGGNDKKGTFCFDNELPLHKELIQSARLCNKLVTNGDYLEFINDAGYQRSEFWLADGWQQVQTQGWRAPLYWQIIDNDWYSYQLDKGMALIDLDAPVAHVSAYEADAYSNYLGMRLPTEQEWEIAAKKNATVHCSVDDHSFGLLEGGIDAETNDWFGCRWQWTGSAYRPYAGFKASEGAVGEYNGKFMSNQWVLRGSSEATSLRHSRVTYRNFFYPHERWQFSGIRLAADEV